MFKVVYVSIDLDSGPGYLLKYHLNEPCPRLLTFTQRWRNHIKHRQPITSHGYTCTNVDAWYVIFPSWSSERSNVRAQDLRRISQPSIYSPRSDINSLTRSWLSNSSVPSNEHHTYWLKKLDVATTTKLKTYSRELPCLIALRIQFEWFISAAFCPAHDPCVTHTQYLRHPVMDCRWWSRQM